LEEACMSEPQGRGVAWTPSSPPNPPRGRGTSDEGRRRLKPPRRRANGRQSPQLIKASITTVLLLFAFFALPELLSLYYIDTMTQVAVYSMVTLAGGLTVVLATVNFPNGGHGFLGYNGGLLHIPPIRRPSFAASDPAYYRFSVIIAIVMFALVLAHIKTKPGRAWAAIRQSEPAA